MLTAAYVHTPVNQIHEEYRVFIAVEITIVVARGWHGDGAIITVEAEMPMSA